MEFIPSSLYGFSIKFRTLLNIDAQGLKNYCPLLGWFLLGESRACLHHKAVVGRLKTITKTLMMINHEESFHMDVVPDCSQLAAC